MPATHFIGLDTHCEFCEMVVVSRTGRVLKRQRFETTIPALVEQLKSVRRQRELTFEEGPLADWLARSLRPYVDRLVVCNPRRNALIAKESDKDDAIDAERLAQLLRGGYLKEVHQVESLDRMVLKQHVGFYHDRVRERVRQGHQLVALLRRYGVFVSIRQLLDEEERQRIFCQAPRRKVLRENLQSVWQVYQLLLDQEQELRATLVRLARGVTQVRRFTELPGIGWVRGLTFYAYIDTPQRFAKKSALWRYCAIGLERRHSGSSVTRVRLSHTGNRKLKNTLLGAAKSAIAQQENPFAGKYHHWTQEQHLPPSTARRNVARCLATTMWSLWKTGSRYDPARVIGEGDKRSTT